MLELERIFELKVHHCLNGIVLQVQLFLKQWAFVLTHLVQYQLTINTIYFYYLKIHKQK